MDCDVNCKLVGSSDAMMRRHLAVQFCSFRTLRIVNEQQNQIAIQLIC